LVKVCIQSQHLISLVSRGVSKLLVITSPVCRVDPACAASDALQLANEINGPGHQVSLAPLAAVLGLLITCIVLQTFALLAFVQKRAGVLSDTTECRWRPRVCKVLISVFAIAAVGRFATAGYKAALKSGFEHDKNAVVWYGDGYGCAVAAIVFSLIETFLVFFFAADMEFVAEYYLTLGMSDTSGSSHGMMDAAAGLVTANADLEAAAAQGGNSRHAAPQNSSYSKLTPDERKAILEGDDTGTGGDGGYQGSSAYANL
jgi:hypothetical protein